MTAAVIGMTSHLHTTRFGKKLQRKGENYMASLHLKAYGEYVQELRYALNWNAAGKRRTHTAH